MANLTIQAIISARNQAGAALSSFRGGLLDIATVLAPIAAGLAAVGAAVITVTKAASEQERADVKLAAALASMGKNTKETRRDLADFVDALENTTEAEDDAIQKSISTLVAFGRLEGEGLKRATRAALDYAAATGTDVVSTSEALANVIAKGQGRLKGIATDFAEGTSKAERFDNVLAQIERKVGGRAAQEVRTFGGAVGLIGKEFDNVLEAMGLAIVKSEAFRVVLKFMAKTFESWAKTIENNPEVVLDFVEGILSAAIGVVEFAASIAQAAEKLRTFFLVMAASQGNLSALRSLFKDLTSDEETFASKIAAGGDKAKAALATLRAEFEASRGKLRDVAGEIENTGEGLDDLGEKLSPLEKAFQSIGVEAFDKTAEKARALDVVTRHLEDQFSKGNISDAKYKALREQLKGIAVDLTAAGESLDEWDVVVATGGGALETLGMGIDDAIEAAAAFPKATADLRAFAEAGVLSARSFQARSADLINMADDMRLAGEAIETGLTTAQELTIQLGDAIQDHLIVVAQDFGTTLVAAAFEGKKAFRSFAREVLADLLKIIARMLAVKAFMFFLNFVTGGGAGVAGGAAGAGGASIGGGLVVAAMGGEVIGGRRGTDSVAAMLTPGEVILPARLRGDFDAISELAHALTSGGFGGPGAAAGGDRSVSVTVQKNPDRDIASLIADINRAVERHGYRLIASETL